MNDTVKFIDKKLDEAILGMKVAKTQVMYDHFQNRAWNLMEMKARYSNWV